VVQAFGLGSSQNGDRPKGFTYGTDLLEPGVASEVEGTRKRHRWWGRKPRPDLYFGFWSNPTGEFVLVNRNSDVRR
jgi:hypothetical protein